MVIEEELRKTADNFLKLFSEENIDTYMRAKRLK